MRIQHNISALNAHRQLGGNNNQVAKNLEKLSSGYKINRAGDDAAGLAISEKMRSQIRGLETAQKNANDGISLIQTAEGALTEVHSMLNRMVELATQSSNGTYTEKDRDKLQSEVDSLSKEIDRIGEGTNFNGISLLNGELGKGTASIAGFDKAGFAATSSSVLVTKMGGVDLSNVGTKSSIVAIAGTTSTTGVGTIKVTYTDKDGKGVINTIDLKDHMKQADGSDWVSAKGNKGVLDLTSVGLGVIEFTAADSNATAANFATDLATAITASKTITATTAGTVGSLSLQVGDTNDSFQKVSVSVDDMRAESLGIKDLKINTEIAAGDAIKTINDAIEKVSTNRANLGAVQNRLEHTINNLGVTTENMTAAEARIRDVDMAKEMMDFTKNNILTQAAQAMLAQANQIPQGVLQLLR